MNLEQLKNKYRLTGAKYEPNPSCRHCKGTGERAIKSRSGQMTFCICLFVDHSASDELGSMLGKFASKELEKLRGNQ